MTKPVGEVFSYREPQWVEGGIKHLQTRPFRVGSEKGPGFCDAASGLRAETGL